MCLITFCFTVRFHSLLIVVEGYEYSVVHNDIDRPSVIINCICWVNKKAFLSKKYWHQIKSSCYKFYGVDLCHKYGS